MMNSSVTRMSLFKVIKFIYETREKSPQSVLISGLTVETKITL